MMDKREIIYLYREHLIKMSGRKCDAIYSELLVRFLRLVPHKPQPTDIEVQRLLERMLDRFDVNISEIKSNIK